MPGQSIVDSAPVIACFPLSSTRERCGSGPRRHRLMGVHARRAVGVVAMALVVTVPAGAADRDLRLVDAAQRQDWRTVRKLVDAKLVVSVPQGDGARALHWAAHADSL